MQIKPIFVAYALFLSMAASSNAANEPFFEEAIKERETRNNLNSENEMLHNRIMENSIATAHNIETVYNNIEELRELLDSHRQKCSTLKTAHQSAILDHEKLIQLNAPKSMQDETLQLLKIIENKIDKCQ